MKTITIDGTQYTVKSDRNPIELAKLARKPYKPKKPKDIRKFPRDYGVPLATVDYIRQFERLNNLASVEYENLPLSGTALYDPTIPLLEALSDAN